MNFTLFSVYNLFVDLKMDTTEPAAFSFEDLFPARYSPEPEVANIVVLEEGPQPQEAWETIHPVTVLAVSSPLTWGPPHQTVEGGSEPH